MSSALSSPWRQAGLALARFVPVLLLTFLFGPLGLLAFALLQPKATLS